MIFNVINLVPAIHVIMVLQMTKLIMCGLVHCTGSQIEHELQNYSRNYFELSAVNGNRLSFDWEFATCSSCPGFVVSLMDSSSEALVEYLLDIYNIEIPRIFINGIDEANDCNAEFIDAAPGAAFENICICDILRRIADTQFLLGNKTVVFVSTIRMEELVADGNWSSAGKSTIGNVNGENFRILEAVLKSFANMKQSGYTLVVTTLTSWLRHRSILSDETDPLAAPLRAELVSDDIDEFEYISVSEGDAHVLIFVFPDQMNAIQRMVVNWKEHCDIATCQLFVHYSILAIEVVSDMVSRSSNNTLPSMRLCLLKAQHWIASINAPKDLIYVLMGVDAATRFPQPGRVLPTMTVDEAIAIRGLIPAVEYGTGPNYRLWAPLVSSRDANGMFDFTAMVGSTMGWNHMLRAIRADGSNRSGDGGLIEALRRYCEQHPERIQVDGSRGIYAFNTNINATMLNSPALDMFGDAEDACDGLRLEAHVQFCSSFNQFLVARVSTNAIQIDMLSILAANMNEAWNHRCWHFLVAYSHFSFLYLHPLSVNGELMETKSSENSIGRFDYVSQSYLYHITRSLRKVSFEFGWKKFQLLRVELERVSSAMESQCSLNKEFQQMHCRNPNGYLVAVYAALAAVCQELGDNRQAVQYMRRSLPLATRQQMETWARQWHYQRQRLNCVDRRQTNSICSRFATHFVTVASNATAGLQNLLFSAKLSGVAVEVLGLDTPYTGYGDKIRLYNNYLSSSTRVRDDDIVVLIDAYDVLLFPSVHKLGQLLQKSPSPIVFCAEYGHYPEFTAAHAYRHYKQSDFLVPNPKFLNSGCIIGRAAQVRDMMADVLATVATIDDDQQAFVRYYLTHRGLIHIDSDNAFSLTGYREAYPSHWPMINLSPILNFSLSRGTRIISGIPILHCNNMGGYSLYSRVLNALAAVVNTYYAGPDRDGNLQALHLLWLDLMVEMVEVIQNSPKIRMNSTRYGGPNDISSQLLLEGARRQLLT